MKKLLVMVAAALSTMLVVSPAFAQSDPSEAEGMVEGVFRVTIEGDVPENYSVYVETDAAVGGLGPICTTDAAIVAEGYTQCVGGGAVNELPFFVPQGSTVEYRILGSQGTGLSQTVIAEGSTVAKTDGFTVDANLAFNGETPAEPPTEPGATEDQYTNQPPADETEGTSADTTKAAGEMSPVAEANGGILPDTGGAPISLLAGAALLLTAGGVLVYRRML